MNPIHFLNRLIESHHYRTYLEIGVAGGDCFGAVQAAVKVGVDPDAAVRELNIPGGLLFCSTSDAFFASVNGRNFFDLVFIDGLHHHEQVHRDVVHALDCLSVGGVIVLHDCNPRSEEMQRVPRVQVEWTGDCWKAVVRLRMSRPDLNVSVLDTDYGLGVVRRGRSELVTYCRPWQELGWEDLAAHRTELLGLTPLSEVDRYLRQGP
ncbi:MAG TPA: class I SAM-dependent methyltransferase [Pirellulales bacterium]|nr:class I SAM-dependent methyltransferase [Pirellulales bacterium]